MAPNDIHGLKRGSWRHDMMHCRRSDEVGVNTGNETGIQGQSHEKIQQHDEVLYKEQGILRSKQSTLVRLII